MKSQLFSFSFLLLLAIALTGRADTPNVLFLAVDDMNDWLGSPPRPAVIERPPIFMTIHKSNHCSSPSPRQVMKLLARESSFITLPVQSINGGGLNTFSAIKVNGKAAGL